MGDGVEGGRRKEEALWLLTDVRYAPSVKPIPLHFFHIQSVARWFRPIASASCLQLPRCQQTGSFILHRPPQQTKTPLLPSKLQCSPPSSQPSLQIRLSPHYHPTFPHFPSPHPFLALPNHAAPTHKDTSLPTMRIQIHSHRQSAEMGEEMVAGGLYYIGMSERKGWTPQEDQALREAMGQPTEGTAKLRWNQVAAAIAASTGVAVRKGKQCRERWVNQLQPGILREASWSRDQAETVYRLQAQLGNHWALIARALPGRSDNSIKNYFYSTLRKALRVVNNFVTSHKHHVQFKNVKPFQASTLSKVLAVAENKAGRKISVNKSDAHLLARDIRQGLIALQHPHPAPPSPASDSLLHDLTTKIQDFNRVCKRKKTKKRSASSSSQQLSPSPARHAPSAPPSPLLPLTPLLPEARTFHALPTLEALDSHNEKNLLHGSQAAGRGEVGKSGRLGESQGLRESTEVGQRGLQLSSSFNGFGSMSNLNQSGGVDRGWRRPWEMGQAEQSFYQYIPVLQPNSWVPAFPLSLPFPSSFSFLTESIDPLQWSHPNLSQPNLSQPNQPIEPPLAP